jgi:hypothetical protein
MPFGTGDSETEVGVGGVVPNIMSLTIGPSGNFGAFQPGVARDYTTSLAATATTTTAAELAVRDPSSQSTGHLVNGTHALAQPLHVRATDAANPDTAFAPLPENGSRLRLLTLPGATNEHPLTVGFRQSIGASEQLRSGSYAKVVVFSLSATTP